MGVLIALTRLLRAHRKRPSRRAADERDELSTFHCQWFPCFHSNAALRDFTPAYVG
jgi:hypothetical protein